MSRRSNASRSGVGLFVALNVHGVAALLLFGVDTRALFTRQQNIIEMDLQEQAPPPPLPPPPEEKRPEPEVKKPEPVRPRLVAMRRPPLPQPPPPRPVQEPPAPPPPNQTPPAEAPQNAPPVFGVTIDTVVAGGPGIAVPVGNTLMTKDRTRAKPSEVKPYSSEGTAPFVPVSDIYITHFPEKLNEVNDPDEYPAEARRMGIEGAVTLSLNLNDKGEVVGARVVVPAGHGFDEAAAKLVRRLRFSPARTADGRAVPYRVTYKYRFELPQ